MNTQYQPIYWQDTGTTIMTNNTFTPVPSSVLVPVPSKKRLIEKMKDRVKISADHIKNISLIQPTPSLPPMSGASPEAETTKRVEHKKKIVLERKVGVKRDKGGGIEETHKGTLELVRTMEGDSIQMGTIGLKSTPNGGTYVEIPIDELRKAIDELDPPKEENKT